MKREGRDEIRVNLSIGMGNVCSVNIIMKDGLMIKGDGRDGDEVYKAQMYIIVIVLRAMGALIAGM